MIDITTRNVSTRISAWVILGAVQPMINPMTNPMIKYIIVIM